MRVCTGDPLSISPCKGERNYPFPLRGKVRARPELVEGMGVSPEEERSHKCLEQ